MAEDVTNQGQDTQTTGTQAPAPTGTDPAPAQPATPTGGAAAQTFSQADVDRLVGKTRTEARDRILKGLGVESEDDIKAALAKLKDIEDAQKTEQERLQAQIAERERALADLQAENARLAQERTETLIRAEIVAKATVRKFRDPSDAYRMVDLGAIEVTEEGAVKGVEDQLDALAKAKPYLVEQQPGIGPTNPGRGAQVGETDAERRARLYGSGDTPIGRSGGGVFWPNKP